MRAWTLKAAALAAVATGVLAVSSAPAQQGPAIRVPDMLPGSYTETISFVSVSGSVPPELRQAVRDKASNTTQFCYNPQAVAGRRPSIFEVQSGKDCRLASATQTGEAASVRMTCEDSETKGSITYDGTFRPTSATFKGAVEVDFVKQKRNMAYTTQVRWERTADTCAAE
jgi:hypothetical protein